MATEAQILANQQNAQHSTGPKSESGKAASCKNNFKYGLTGSSFTVLEFEDQDEYDQLLCGLRFEHQPSTMTESILVEEMAQSYWLRKRALYLQDLCATDEQLSLEHQEKRLALFIRYQTTHDRAFPPRPQRPPKGQSRKAQAGNWVRIAAAEESSGIPPRSSRKT
jgi:hypothetical protein